MPEAMQAGMAPADRSSSGAMSDAKTAAPSGDPSTAKRRPRWWKPAMRALTVLFIAAVVALLAMQARAVKWDEVGTAISRMRAADLAAAAALTTLSFFVYSLYDLLGRAYTGHRLGRAQVMTVGFISYAFNLNLGSWVGGIGFRYRLYSKLGLDNAVITRILVLSLATNWAGYMALAGMLFSARLLAAPAQWKVSTDTLQGAGFVFLGLVSAYLCLCAFAKRRHYRIKGHDLALPSLRMALAQLALSMTNWSLMGTIMWLLLGQQAPFATVFCVLMVSSVAGLLTHIPANLGVLEAVFVALLAGQLDEGAVLGAVLAYRATYYLAPLVIATIVYAITEARVRRRAFSSSPGG